MQLRQACSSVSCCSTVLPLDHLCLKFYEPKGNETALSCVAIALPLQKRSIFSSGKLTSRRLLPLHMCQYYRWQCHQCTGTNDVVVRCRSNLQYQRRDPCTRGQTLPLPSDAPKLECQQCSYCRGPGGGPEAPSRARTPGHHGLDTSFRRLSLQTPYGHPTSSNQAAVSLLDFQYPSEHDVFWLNPQSRLPDPATSLSEYNKQRAKVFQKADEEKKEMMHLATEGEKISQVNRNAAWEGSWSALQEALRAV